MTEKQKENLKIFNKKNNKIKIFNYKIFNSIVLLLIAIFGVSFVAVKNDLTVSGFVIRDSRINISDLQKKQELLEAKVMSLKSYERLDKEIEKLKMVRANEISYLEVRDIDVAKK